MLEELFGPERDGTSQRDRRRAELDPGYVRLDERTPADLIAFAADLADHLLWYGPDGVADGSWAPMFDGLRAIGGPGVAAAFAADPAAFADPRYAALRRPHVMLLLACVRLMRHAQDAVNAVAERHYEHQLREVLRLAPAPARPDRAFVLFDLAPGVAAAEAPAGLRLLAGRDARRHDRVFRLDEGLVVTRARVAALATSFVDRQVVGLADAREAEPGTAENKTLALLRLAYGTPRPGDPLPPLRGAALTADRWRALATLVAFAGAALHLELFELRALVARKRRRDSADADWALINATLEAAGRAKRKDPAWTLAPKDPRAFAANVRKAYGGDPMLDNGLEEVATLDDLMLHLDEPPVRAFIRDRLFLDAAAQFVPMMTAKRAADADWQVINGYLETASARQQGRPAWHSAAETATAFDRNLVAAVGPIDWKAAGPEAAGVGDVGGYLDRLAEIEGWFRLPAEKLAVLLPALDAADDGPAWARAEALLAEAHARLVRERERGAMRQLRQSPPPGVDGLRAALAEATSEPPASAGLIEALARYAAAADVQVVRDALDRAAPTRADAAGWDRIDGILADARRRRLSLPEPVAAREHWRALWAEADAPAAAGVTSWPSFGAVPADAGPERPPATLGWAIASPALALSAGRRRIVLTLGFDDDAGGPLAGDTAPFVASLSTGDAWLEPAAVEFTDVSYDKAGDTAPVENGRKLIALRVAFILDEGDPATAPPAAGPGDTRWPVLRLLLRPRWDPAAKRYETAYERFRSLRLVRAHLRVTVGGDGPGLWPLDVETDAGTVDGKKPFEPWGAAAPVGAELAIGHRDLAGKRLTALAPRLQWLGAPADLAAHYANYPARDFRAQYALVDGRVRVVPLGDVQPLFGADPAAPLRTGPLAVKVPADGTVEPPALPVRARRRYLLATLAGTGFGQSEYAGLASSKAIALSAALRTGTVSNPDAYAVRPPYTPKLKRLELDLVAVHEVDVASYDRAVAIDRLYHLHPFGTVEAPTRAADGWPLLPAYDEEGALYVGLDGVAAPQTLSLLFETVAVAGTGRRPAGLAWSYLDATGWTRFAEPPRDGSLGLQRSGLVRFTLPEAAPDGRMPRGLYWLRATLDSGADAALELVGVHAQAGAATFDAGTDAEPRDAALPAGTIRTLGDPAPGILKVVQPYPSFDGAPAEPDAAFRIRAGERLRHKNRALTMWDYERIVLARFPQVHKVKCLPATVEDGPGRVRIVVVPDIRDRRRADPFAPLAPASLLDEVRDHLRPLAPAAARIEVGHPHFVRVRVRVGVRFRNLGDEEFDKRRLNDALNRHLAPWAFDEGADVALGQRIDATALVAFIDGLPFVDFVGGCRLFQSDDGEDYRSGLDGGEAVAATRRDAILTPAERHEIDVIADDVFAEQRFTGIGYMKIELDFVVS